MTNFQDRLLRVIPGGTHTYSRGFDQFPSNAPQILSRGKGGYVFDVEGNRFLDYGMGLRAVNIGYAEDEINDAAINEILNGNNLTRASLIELEAAELMVELIDSIDMVKFTKNGSAAVSAAVKLARAYTGRTLIARCADHPFFSYDDWFIGSTPLTRGITSENIENTKLFQFNNISSLEDLISEHAKQIACVVMEPAATEEPKDQFLQKVHELCQKNGIVFILDEMITGFRWNMKGAQYTYGVKPDLCTFGKAMANGFSVSCVGGHRDIMKLGSIEEPGLERVFLLSSTHGAEMAGLGAFIATIRFMQRNNVVEHIWNYGSQLKAMMERQAKAHNVDKSFKVGGVNCSPYYATLDSNGNNSLALRTLFAQEMVQNRVLMPWISICYRHNEAEFASTETAISNTFDVYRQALLNGVESYLNGDIIKPVFRKYN